jgi:hypothetical protein
LACNVNFSATKVIEEVTVMIRRLRYIALLPTFSFILLSAAISYSVAAAADEPPPPTAPENGARHHHNPAFAACKKQADDQKLEPGDARRDFMRNCMKSAEATAPKTS